MSEVQSLECECLECGIKILAGRVAIITKVTLKIAGGAVLL